MLTLAQFYRRLGLRRRENAVTVFLRAISDEAGTDQNHDYVVAGGCVGADSEWGQTEKKWDAVLNRNKVTLFHAVDFSNKKGEFNGWSQLKRNRFYDALSRIIKKAPVFVVAVAVDKKTHTDIKKQMHGVKGFTYDSDYGLAFRFFRFFVCEEIYKQDPTAKIDFIVERGPYSGNLESIYNDLFSTVGAEYQPAKYAEMMHNFLSLQKGQLRGLEIADFLADRALKAVEAGAFKTKYGENRRSFLADEDFLRGWRDGMLDEKNKRREFGSSSTA